MAMNNWGGIKEHMTKKPKKFFSNRRANRSIGSDANIQLPEDKIERAEKEKKNKLIREIVIYFVIFVSVTYGIILFTTS